MGSLKNNKTKKNQKGGRCCELETNDNGCLQKSKLAKYKNYRLGFATINHTKFLVTGHSLKHIDELGFECLNLEQIMNFLNNASCSYYAIGNIVNNLPIFKIGDPGLFTMDELIKQKFNLIFDAEFAPFITDKKHRPTYISMYCDKTVIVSFKKITINSSKVGITGFDYNNDSYNKRLQDIASNPAAGAGAGAGVPVIEEYNKILLSQIDRSIAGIGAGKKTIDETNQIVATSSVSLGDTLYLISETNCFEYEYYIDATVPQLPDDDTDVNCIRTLRLINDNIDLFINITDRCDITSSKVRKLIPLLNYFDLNNPLSENDKLLFFIIMSLLLKQGIIEWERTTVGIANEIERDRGLIIEIKNEFDFDLTLQNFLDLLNIKPRFKRARCDELTVFFQSFFKRYYSRRFTKLFVTYVESLTKTIKLNEDKLLKACPGYHDEAEEVVPDESEEDEAAPEDDHEAAAPVLPATEADISLYKNLHNGIKPTFEDAQKWFGTGMTMTREQYERLAGGYRKQKKSIKKRRLTRRKITKRRKRNA